MQGVKTKIPTELPEWARSARPDACFSARDLLLWLGISKATLARKLKEKRIPEPDFKSQRANKMHGHTNQWCVGTIRAWMAEQNT
jgi:predicted DNA-binding transcriptional regulator AlpA